MTASQYQTRLGGVVFDTRTQIYSRVHKNERLSKFEADLMCATNEQRAGARVDEERRGCVQVNGTASGQRNERCEAG